MKVRRLLQLILTGLAAKPQSDQILRNLSFLSVSLESLALLGVTIMTAVMSIKRNRYIDWGNDFWYPYS